MADMVPDLKEELADAVPDLEEEESADAVPDMEEEEWPDFFFEPGDNPFPLLIITEKHLLQTGVLLESLKAKSKL